jgi:hypothetical protein
MIAATRAFLLTNLPAVMLALGVALGAALPHIEPNLLRGPVPMALQVPSGAGVQCTRAA